MGATTLEVDRAVLLARLRKARERAKADHEAELATYPKRLEAWNAKVSAELTKLAGKLNGKPIAGFRMGYEGRLEVPIRPGPKPERPSTNHLCKYDRAIEMVELTKADVFRLRTDDSMLALIVPDKC
jgi:hypothetical protein